VICSGGPISRHRAQKSTAFRQRRCLRAAQGLGLQLSTTAAFSGLRLFGIFNLLTSDARESVLIIDDSPYNRSRSRWVDLLSRVWGHSTGRFLKGFQMLTICWSDGTSCLPMDFFLFVKEQIGDRLNPIPKVEVKIMA